METTTGTLLYHTDSLSGLAIRHLQSKQAEESDTIMAVKVHWCITSNPIVLFK